MLLIGYAIVFEGQTARGYETVGNAPKHRSAKRTRGGIGQSEYSELHSTSSSTEVERSSVYEPAEDGT